jgi:hypothetical protein
VDNPDNPINYKEITNVIYFAKIEVLLGNQEKLLCSSGVAGGYILKDTFLLLKFYSI